MTRLRATILCCWVLGYCSPLPAQLDHVFDSTYTLTYLYESLNRADHTQDSALTARASYGLGLYYLGHNNEQNTAFQYLFKSRRLFLQIGDTTGFNQVNQLIAGAYEDDFARIAKEREQYNFLQERQKNRFVTLLVVFFFVVVISGIVMVVYNQRYHDQQTIARQLEEINRQKISALEQTLHTETLHAMLAGQEAERQRVSKDLHDGLGGLLASIKYKIENLLSTIPRQNKDEAVIQLIDTACDEVRNITFNLQPFSIEKFGLPVAIGDMVNKLSSGSTAHIEYQQLLKTDLPGGEFATHTFRIVQELVTNALKHAQARQILVQLSTVGPELVVLVEDDGKGFDPALKQEGNGLKNIQSRLKYLKGTVEWQSAPGEGTSVLMHLPMPNRL